MPAWRCSRTKPLGFMCVVCRAGEGKMHENKWKMLTVVLHWLVQVWPEPYHIRLYTHTFIHTKKVRMKAFRKEWLVHAQWKQSSLDIGNQIPDSLGIQGKRGGSWLSATMKLIMKQNKWKRDKMKHRCFCLFEPKSFHTMYETLFHTCKSCKN